MNFFDTTDFEHTIRDFEFTRRASRQIREIVESIDFLDMDSAAIFRYLYEQMEIVSFKDYLKRYLYERTDDITEPFRTVPEETYSKLITEAFEKNAAPHFLTPTSTKWTNTVKGWLRHDSVRRETVFLLGFGLCMPDTDVSSFLTKVLKDEDFNFSDPRETVFWYCYHNRKNYSVSEELLKEAYDSASQDSSEHRDRPVIGNVSEAVRSDLGDIDVLKPYLRDLCRSGISMEKQQSAYRNFTELLEQTKTEIQKIQQEEEHNKEITSADVEKVICSGIPVTGSGNLQKASSSIFSKQFHNFRLSRQRIDNVLKKQQQVDRYDLITLAFFIYSQKDYTYPEDRCKEFIDEMNHILRDSGMMELHPVNPYEAFVLMCLVTEYPLGTYSDVWEMSYT